MNKCAPFSNKLFAIVIAGEYLVSFVLDLNANPRIAIFLDETVPKKVSIINLEILFFCHSFKNITCSQF